jgi:secreted trypsin-like serine protease
MRVFLVLLFAFPGLVWGRYPGQRIVGGAAADDGEWPWQLALENLGSFSCGAVLLGANYGVTAAHCVGGSPGILAIVAGTNQRSCGDGDCFRDNLVTAERHPDFVNSGAVGFPNDIAYIQWTTAVVEEPGNIQFIVMASTADQNDGRICYITGWGRLDGGGILPENLQEASIDLLTEDECTTYWSDISISTSQVCIFDEVNQEKGACNGDSGGPLVCALSAGGWELVGLTSWCRHGCSTEFPSVYSRVSAFRDWVLGNIPLS